MDRDFEIEMNNFEELRACFDCLASLVILHAPEIWEYYLEDFKKTLIEARKTRGNRK